MRKKIILLMISIMLILSSCSTSRLKLDNVVQNSSNNDNNTDNEYVLMVKKGYNESNPDISYGKAFENFFANPSWKYFKGEESQDVVEFTGDCTYMDVDVKALIQFTIDKENNEFEATYLSLNEVPQNMLTLSSLMAKVFEKESTPDETALNETNDINEEQNNKTEFTAYEAKRIFEKWLSAHPLGLESRLELISEDATNGNDEDCYVFQLSLVKEGEEDIDIDKIFITKANGSMTIGAGESKTLDKWYKQDWLNNDWDIYYNDNDNSYSSEYILPNSDSEYLTMDDLKGFSANDCRLARNELYARYGRKFDSKDLQDHFNSCSWYYGVIEPDDFKESILNDIEIANRDLIVRYEEKMGYR